MTSRHYDHVCRLNDIFLVLVVVFALLPMSASAQTPIPPPRPVTGNDIQAIANSQGMEIDTVRRMLDAGIAPESIDLATADVFLTNLLNTDMANGQQEMEYAQDLIPMAVQPDLTHRYVLFLDGIRTSSQHPNPLNGDFEVMRQSLQDAGFSKFVYFSYGVTALEVDGEFTAFPPYCNAWVNQSGASACEGSLEDYFDQDLDDVLHAIPVYETEDTKLPLRVQIEVLDWFLGQIVEVDPDARIDLIGFSLGGIVATYWASTLGETSSYKDAVRSIILLNSPVGGIPLAGPAVAGCEWNWWNCKALEWALTNMFGRYVLSSLQLPQGPDDLIPESIVDDLPKAARLFPITSIQSTSDYLVNGKTVPICIAECAPFIGHIEPVPVGRGTQQFWYGIENLHEFQLSEYDELVEGVTKFGLLTVFDERHGPVRSHPQTIAWVEERLLQNDSASRSVDAALVIDSSGSMTSNDPRNLRKDAAKVFANAMQNSDQLAVVDFDSTVKTLWQLQPLGDDRTAVHQAIDRINSSGGTNIGAGLQGGYNQLLLSTTDSPKAAILLTDGDGSYSNQASLFANKGWKVFTVGLGSATNENLLRQIVQVTNGEYFALTNAQQLVDIYFRLSAVATGGSNLFIDTIPLNQGETKTLAANIAPNQLAANFLTTWPGSIVDTVLIAPNGDVITPTTSMVDSSVSHLKGTTFELYQVQYPTPGNWTIQVYGADLPVPDEPVSIQVAGRGLEGNTTAYVQSVSGVPCSALTWTAESWIVNGGSEPLESGSVMISLPPTLRLAEGQALSQSVDSVLPGAQHVTQWRIVADPQSTATTLEYRFAYTFTTGLAEPAYASGMINLPDCRKAPTLINAALVMEQIRTVYDSTPTVVAPAGIYTIRASFKNVSSDPIDNLIMKVDGLSDNLSLVNSTLDDVDGSAAVLVPKSSFGADGILSSGEIFDLDFVFGLKSRIGFTIMTSAYTNVFGDVPGGQTGGDGFTFVVPDNDVAINSCKDVNRQCVYLPSVAR